MDRDREAVEDLIEESYLLSLSETAVNLRMKAFARMCDRCIRDSLEDSDHIEDLFEKLATMMYLYDKALTSDEEELVEMPDDMKKVRNIVRKRRLALRIIERFAPEAARLIIHEMRGDWESEIGEEGL